MLDASWASRQQQLDALNNSGTLWSTYGANQTQYNDVMAELSALHIPTVASDGYVSSAASRTIWVQIDEHTAPLLFGPSFQLLGNSSGNDLHWNGYLSLPTGWASTLGVSGLWFDTSSFASSLANPGHGTAVPLPQGWQSLGNGTTTPANISPEQIAAYYHFPFTGDLWDPTSGTAPATGAIGLVEPGVGSAVPAGSSFADLLNAYRSAIGINAPAQSQTIDLGGQSYPMVTPPAFNPAGERSLDVGVVTAVNPQSPMLIYAGSGYADHAQSNAFTAYQSAFWDLANNPDVITSSFNFTPQTAPGSPFYFAAQQLFIDAALRGITVFNDNGDGGSSDQFGNGLTNVQTSRASPFAMMVGGTSFSTIEAAMADPTLGGIVGLAMAHDPGTLWQLVAVGLTAMPEPGNSTDSLLETVWNQYYVNGSTIAARNGTGYLHNNTTSGGVDPSQPAPPYQLAFGLDPVTSDPSVLHGRGTPDVSADAGGNMHYLVPGPAMTGLDADFGTSAATPLWAALASQINAVFHDQGLPSLGYANDLFYIAAAVAPGGFNDVTMGNYTSSFFLGGEAGDTYTSDGTLITPTGYGYLAGPGYDLATGLGTPNGILVARAVTAIAHTQMHGTSPDMLDSNASGDWHSGADQGLMFQAMSAPGATVQIDLGKHDVTFDSGPSDSYAWTMRMAQQSLQADFDPNLVRLFDKQSLGVVGEAVVSNGEGVSISIDGAAAGVPQGTLTSPFGVADFVSSDGDVRVARPVAIADTAGGADDTTAIVRVRQGGQDSNSVTFYRVDDLTGKIGDLSPGNVGYDAAAMAHAYQLTTGGTAFAGPGYGSYAETGLVGVNQGDLIAMKFTDTSTGSFFWAFAHANETVNGQPVGHLWNFGLNTFGWEDTFGGGDHDYNDLLVQFDFTSAAGHGWLA